MYHVLGEGETGNCTGGARTGELGLCGILLAVFLSFCYKGVGKTVRYNDTRDANKGATYCIIHELLLIKALRLMSAFHENLFIFFYGVSPRHLIHPHPPSP
jgi:hypothetical protein